MGSMLKKIVSGSSIILFGVAFALPLVVNAFPFGGQAGIVKPCYNDAIYTNLGPPRGGPYIWTSSTKTYQFGPPTFAGQWLLGLASAPYYCVVSIQPVIVWPGTEIDMMGSSGGGSLGALLSGAGQGLGNGNVPAPITSYNNPHPPSSNPPPTPTPTPTPSPTPTPIPTPASTGHVVISEVFYNVDSAHGTAPLNQWVELYNGSSATVNFSGWTIQDSLHVSAIPGGITLAPGQYLVILASSATQSHWAIPTSAKVVSLNASIEGGLSSTGDAVILKSGTGVITDSVSWGTNVSAFSPSVPTVKSGYSIARSVVTQDTDTAKDWTQLSLPTPGH